LVNKKIFNFFLKEYLFVITLFISILIIFFTKKIPQISIDDIKIIAILFMLFASIKALENSAIIKAIAYKIEKGSLISSKLIIGTFFLSMFLTNDVALIAIVPLTLSLNIKNKASIVIFEAIAANAGSALTPFGNPQNLYIYLFYHLKFLEFFKIILPFAIFNFILLLVISLFINPKQNIKREYKNKIFIDEALLGAFALSVTILTIFHILPLNISFWLVLVALILKPRSLKIDYFLLLTFLLFFAITNSLEPILANYIQKIRDIFLYSAISSQIISNVPTALLFAKFTSNYQALLWGVNVGGFGFIVGSLANLIAYKLFTSSQKQKGFFIKFNAINIAFLLINIIFYYIL